MLQNFNSLYFLGNGAEIGSEACAVTPGTNSRPLYLGQRGGQFGGTIKSFAMWDRALSAEEVAGLDSSKLTCI